MLNKRQLKKLANKIIKSNKLSENKLKYDSEKKGMYTFSGHCNTTLIEVFANKTVRITSNVNTPYVSLYRVINGCDLIFI